MKGLITIHDTDSGMRFTAFLDAEDGTRFSALLPSLTNMTGTDGGNARGIAVDGRAVPVDSTIKQAGLHEGSWISLVGRSGRVLNPYACTDRNDGYVQLRIVSGVNAGAVYDVSQGTMSVGKLMATGETSVNADFMLDVSADGDARMIPHIYASERLKTKHWFSRRKLRLKSGVFVDGKEIVEPMPLPSGTEVVLPECIVCVTKGRRPEIPLDTTGSDSHWLFARPPKIRGVVKQRTFRLPSEPTKPEKAPMPILASLLPLAMSVAMVLIMKNYTFLLFGLMTPVMMISSYISGNRRSRKMYRQQMKRYRQNAETIQNEARKAVDAEIARSREEYPDPTMVLDLCARHTAQLWNRRSTDDSWLHLRVGTGTVDSHVTLEDPQKMEFERVRKWQLHEFPVTVSLPDSGCVGCTGDPAVLYPVVQWMVAQLAALHSTRDMELYLLAPHAKTDDSGIDWTFAQWLPQCAPHSGQNALRMIAVSAQELAQRISELIAMLDTRESEKRNQSAKRWNGSAVVVIMEHPHVLRSMPGTIRLLQEGPAVGMYMLCIDTDERLLPEECQTVVTAEPDALRVESNFADDVYDIMPDLVSREWLDAIAGALAPIEDGSPSDAQSAIPDHSRLLDLLKLTPTPEQIEARWSMYPRSTSCVIGESVDGPFRLDISKDGPHGLIAGTTGSGKSELLQSLVASLAVANTPEALNFVLVDYKGGAAFKDCVKLPHTVGMVTDLDNHLVSRALTSLGAELTYREHLLAQAGAKDLEDYIDMREAKPQLKEIPRLLIVIDEFASLARELPDFVTGLVNIAQRGRSLGIHLLLATQRPGGVVSPEIRANTNLRIALRMTDTSESQDVIDAKDAALISKSTPGRAVVRLGSSSLVPFQSARVGGRYVLPSTSSNASHKSAPFIRALSFEQLGAPAPQRPKSKGDKGDVNVTDLGVLVDSINEVARREHIPEQRKPWLPALPESLSLDDLERDGREDSGIVIPFALGDYPQSQRQSTVSVDVKSFGNMFIIGTSRSGKSTALKTIAYHGSMLYSARRLHFYCIDAGGGAISPLAALPNVGAVALRSETPKIERLLNKLDAEIKRRAALLSRDGYSGIDEYNAAHRASLGREGREAADDRPSILPHVVVLVDSWEGFNAVFQTYDGGSLIDRMQLLMREGPSSGVHFILTGDRSLTSGRMSVLSDSKVLLRLVDKSDYTDVGMSSRDVPDTIPDGRGYRSEDGAEIQIAQIRADVTGQEESALIRTTGRQLKERRDGVLGREDLPFAIEQLPDEIGIQALRQRIEERGETALLSGERGPRIPIGLGGEDNDLVVLDPHTTAMLPVYGTQRSGKTTMLVTIAGEALHAGYHLVIAAPKNNALRAFAGMPGVEQVFTMAAELTQDALAEYVDDPNVLYLFDDCQLLKDVPASTWLQSLVGVLDTDKASFVVAGDAAEFPQGFGNWGSRIKTLKQGVLLKPDELMYQDLIGMRLKRTQISADTPAGRGFMHVGDAAMTVQIAKGEVR